MSAQNQMDLTISWRTSRTTGFNICRLRDESTGKFYKVDGGGFNMIAYVFAEWAGDVFHEAIHQAQEQGKTFPSFVNEQGRIDASSVAGINEVTYALKLIGLSAEPKRDFNGSVVGFNVSGELEHQEKITTELSM